MLFLWVILSAKGLMALLPFLLSLAVASSVLGALWGWERHMASAGVAGPAIHGSVVGASSEGVGSAGSAYPPQRSPSDLRREKLRYSAIALLREMESSLGRVIADEHSPSPEDSMQNSVEEMS